MNYSEYLNSKHWQDLKAAKSKATPKRCAICASRSRIELHHLFYRWPWTETQLQDTRWLCYECHSTIHRLIKTGVVKFPKPENHHSCFVITKNAVKKARGVAIAQNLFHLKLNAMMTSKGGYTKAVLASFGIPWPPPKGWKKHLISKITTQSKTC